MENSTVNIKTATINDINNPETYKGIYSFHKYWGKKPVESIAYFIENFTKPTDIVLDPFLGSGMISKECLDRNRRFIGIDINPFSIEHTKFILNLPSEKEYLKAIKEIENNIKEKINSTYIMANNKIATHYLWDENNLLKVWTRPEKGRSRIEVEPTAFDLKEISKYDKYEVKNIRKMNLYTNSRINAKIDMTINDFFTRRALHNIDLIISEINKYSLELQRALYLTLTSSVGQMSTMVFAISGRGKTKNNISEKIEVGSWVIGFWRPKLHFEINVWNCFESKAKKLYKALCELTSDKNYKSEEIEIILNKNNGISIINDNCIDIIKKIPNNSIKLVCTDPPHSDRIPYLELSEIWNAILNKNVEFEKEIVVSNAKERNKEKNKYNNDMNIFISELSRILTKDGIVLIYYNARDKKSWEFIETVQSNNDLEFVGTFPMEYSANSVVQDNRKGGMKTDYILIIQKKGSEIMINHELKQILGWQDTIPKMGE